MQDDAPPGERMVDDEGGRRVPVTDRLPSEHIDGAWWPRSTDLVTELPGRWCQKAAAQFDEAPVQTFVPILVEHLVRNRMYHARAATRC
jgi:hypothetical protein